jgi:hypothetical protein
MLLDLKGSLADRAYPILASLAVPNGYCTTRDQFEIVHPA